MRCPKCSHVWTPSIKSAAKALGGIKSDKKSAASRRNGRLGGRPKKIDAVAFRQMQKNIDKLRIT